MVAEMNLDSTNTVNLDLKAYWLNKIHYLTLSGPAKSIDIFLYNRSITNTLLIVGNSGNLISDLNFS